MELKEKAIYFGENGLTSTSANFIANKAKELVNDLMFTDLSFVNVDISSVNNVMTSRISNGVDSLASIKDKLTYIAKLHSLEAWLREAIKAKEALVSTINNYSSSDYCKIENVENPTYIDTPLVREEDYLAALSEHDRVEYLQAQAYASVFGKFVHPGGTYANARESLKKSISNPSSFNSTENADYVYTYTPSVDASEVEEMYFDLQNEQREWQAKYNKYQYDMEVWMNDKNQEIKSLQKQNHDKYYNELKKVESDFYVWKSNLKNQVRDLKIIIPKSLKSIYDAVAKR